MRPDDRPQTCVECGEALDRKNREHAEHWPIWVNLVDKTTGHAAVACKDHAELVRSSGVLNDTTRFEPRPTPTSWWDVELGRWF